MRGEAQRVMTKLDVNQDVRVTQKGKDGMVSKRHIGYLRRNINGFDQKPFKKSEKMTREQLEIRKQMGYKITDHMSHRFSKVFVFLT